MNKKYSEGDYEVFEKNLETNFPHLFPIPYGGICVGSGWWHIIESLCRNIQGRIDNRQRIREVLLKSNPTNIKIPDEIPQVVVEQIKEKFGGLRFYYRGGDDMIDGMVRMAESWAGNTCETCGDIGEMRHGDWIRTLCDFHAGEGKEKNEAPL